MAKPEQVLIIDPANELVFQGPFVQAVSSAMRLTNPSEQKVCFKIKTTAPKRYCVKPNSGVIDPKQTIAIAVSLQPFDFDPQEKNRHKFMVQAMYAPDGELNTDTLWKEMDPNAMMDSKLRCVFVVPEENSPPSAPQAVSTFSQSPPSGAYGDVDSTAMTHVKQEKVPDSEGNLKKSLEEIRRLQEEISALRQDNIEIREESLRQKRLAANQHRPSPSASDSQAPVGFTSTVVTANAPEEAFSTTHLYAALVILILGIILGKWIF